ncbi:MAG: extracellular solute-binding protein [Anaerolineales bacterium]|nr:MAG: extracellular solute-binding protein [Anaerolineales bacterium]
MRRIRMSKKLTWFLLLAFLVPILLTACGPAATEVPPEPTVAEQAPPPETEEPVVPEPVEPSVDPSGQTVSFWHVWGTGTVGEGMMALIDEFNTTNEYGITVEGVDQGRYSDLEDAMNAAIQSGDVPNILVGYTNALDTWYSVDVMADINTFIDDPYYGLTAEEVADFYPGTWANGINADGARVGFPHGQSANVVFYNVTWAKELGFDSAPATAEEFRAQACAATEANASDDDPDNDGTGGYVLYTGASDIAAWIFAFGGNVYDQAGTGYDFETPAVEEVAGFLKGLWDDGCAFATESYPNPEFATRKALFTLSSTAGLPYQASAFEAEGAYSEDEWTFIAFPGPAGGTVNGYAQNTGIVRSTPEQEMASWLFIKWFTSPETLAKWIEASGYHPVRGAVVPLLGDYIAANPRWATGIDLVPLGVAEPGWSSWGTVRRDVQDTFAAILQGDPADIPALLADLNAAAAEAMEETS